MSQAQGIALVPVDFSEASLSALQTARGMVDDVHVVTVLERPEDLVGAPAADNAQREAQVREELVRVCGAECTHHVRFGDPGAEIAQLGADIGAALIVISARGRGDSPVALGSTVDRVLRMAEIPVHLIRG